VSHTADALNDWGRGWVPPSYQVDNGGKVVGATAGRTPNNWGRWGNLDEIGTVNLLTPERIRAAAGLALSGEVVGCGIPIAEEMPVHPSRPSVVHTHAITGTDVLAGLVEDRANGGFFGSDDYLSFPLQSATHRDGLTHAYYADTMYNGFWLGNVGASGGAR
jgi:hypothetical protein